MMMPTEASQKSIFINKKARLIMSRFEEAFYSGVLQNLAHLRAEENRTFPLIN